MAWTLVQQSAAQASGTGPVANTLPGTPTAGNLLIGLVSSGDGAALTAPANWSQVAVIANSTSAQAAVFAYFGNPGASLGTSFSFGGGVSMRVSVLEFTCPGVASVTAASGTGTGTAGAVTSLAVTTSGGVQAGDLSAACFMERSPSGAQVWTDPPGYTEAAGLITAAGLVHGYAAYDLAVSAGGAQSVTVTGSLTGGANGWAGAVATFTQPSPPGGAVAYAPGWQPGTQPGMPGGVPFTPWPQYVPGAAAAQDPLAAAATVTAALTASLASAPAGWELPPQYPPAWFPAGPSAPGGEPFTPWPLGQTGVNSAALTAAQTVTATGAAALTGAKPLNAATTVTATGAAAAATAKPLTAAQTVTGARSAALAEAKPVNAAATVTAALAAALATQPAGLGSFTTAPGWVPAWFPGAPAVPAAEPFTPWPPWAGAAVPVAVLLRNAASAPAVTAQDTSAATVAAMVSVPAVTAAGGSVAAVAAQAPGSAVTQQASSSPAVSDE